MGMIGEVFALAGLHIDNASFSKYGSELKAAEGQISDFSSTSQAMMAGAFTLPAAAIGSIISYGTELASSFEDASTTLTTVYGSLDVAKEKFQWLSDFAASTPFEFPELLDATVKLKAYGIEAQDYMTVIGDTSSAMGKSVNDTVEAVADAMTGEFERMKEYGIKAVQVTKANLEQYAKYGASVGETMLTYVDSSGKQMAQVVDRNNREMILSTISAIWNEKYAGAMETRSKTLSGLMSTLKDNLTMGLADIIGFDMKNMEIQSNSLIGVFKSLAETSVSLTSGLSNISEPMQTLITVAALGVAGIGLMAAGFIAYNAILPLATAETGLFGVTLSAAIWPVTAVVGGLALLAAGLVWLDEKTGVVSAAWTFLADTFTMASAGISEAIDFLKDEWDLLVSMVENSTLGSAIIDAVSGITDGFDLAGGSISKFLDSWHQVAEEIRGNSGDVKTSTDEVNTSIEGMGTTTKNVEATTTSSTGNMAGAWDTLKSTVVGNNNEMAASAETAAKNTGTAWDKAFQEMQKNYDNMRVATEVHGLKTKDPKLIDSLAKGIQGNGELLGLNSEQELVIETFDGVVTKLEEMDAAQVHVFNGIDKNYAIIIDDGTKKMDQLDQEAIKYREMGYEVMVVASDVSQLNGQSLEGVTTQAMGLSAVMDGTSDGALILQGQLSAVNGQPMSDIVSQITGVNSATDTGAIKAGFWQTSIISVNNSPLSAVQSQISTTGVMTDTSALKAQDWNTVFGVVNAAPFGTVQGNISTTGWLIDDDKTKTGELNTNLLKTNNSPFSSLFSNLSTGGVKVGDLKTKTDETNTSMRTLGSFSFSGTLSSLGSIWSKLGDILERAKNTATELLKIGSSSGGSSGSVTKNSNNKTSTTNTTNNYYGVPYKSTATPSEIIAGIKRASGG